MCSVSGAGQYQGVAGGANQGAHSGVSLAQSAAYLGELACAQARTPVHVLRELGGWECVEMVRKYAHFSAVHLTEYVDRASNANQVKGNKVATIQLRAENEKGAAFLQPLLVSGAPGRI